MIAYAVTLSAVYSISTRIPLLPVIITAVLINTIDSRILLVSSVIGEFVGSFFGAPSIPLYMLFVLTGVIQQFSTIYFMPKKFGESIKRFFLHILILSAGYILLFIPLWPLFKASFYSTLRNLGVPLLIPEYVLMFGAVVACMFISAVTWFLQLIARSLLYETVSRQIKRIRL